ncbi:MAG: hypothetical protein AUJ92_08560 [Armatimonadetes bacterium CG2_30_59_28]|nr:acetylxylan esterase [Armatimonadota bacterium]OIO95113.1 MAG: hypothetical protein AUJ92_08560 [Armatimonadetes bacterium CG2_30_59_28]PIU61235.1 MAG: hypothetical protein COS85_21450 [Armatimonadetes bacterium CG07_land_8_20_14_0_80_59_28]PIX41211.1 MAG: hypothetical protein COZ56_12635 [Armatimonadetes bacterium CG_4_8_14_3_um_filter_58_9]PIY48164.1 MAG: hypothetical protein COZ05_03865 [Armatimonadetes bacterium CG_4_10_14_3_um_filter_59_10]
MGSIGQGVSEADGPAVTVKSLEDGGVLCETGNYAARLDSGGNLASLKSGQTEFLGAPLGFAFQGKVLPPIKLRQEDASTVVAEGKPKNANSTVNSPCPFEGRITYRFGTDRIELTLEQSLEMYGGLAWIPSSSVTASRDNLTDYPIQPGGAAPYGQTDPRWTTKEGPVLRFDLGVWQRGFANANWRNIAIDGKSHPSMQNTVPATGPIKTTIYPMAKPGPQDALTFDIDAESPDFLLSGGRPVHFNIQVTNAGPEPMDATVRFEVCDYLTQKAVAGKSTQVSLASKATMALPTDLEVKEPGPYRGAISILDGDEEVRRFRWVFTYDFQNYNPPNTRPDDFTDFWRVALDESNTIPLDIQMTHVPEKSTNTVDAFKVSYATLGGRRIYGWYSRPKAEGRYAAHIRFPSSGIYPLAQPEMATDRCCLWIMIHGFDVDLSNMPQGDDPGKNYWTAGIQSPKTSMWRTIYVSLVRAVDFMLAQPQVDPNRVAVVGGSQGGGLAMVCAGLDSRVKFCMPNHSGLPRLDWTVKHTPGYWPFGMNVKPEGQTEEQFLKTLSYFDPANFTQDIQCPVAAEIGMMDTVTAAGNQICALAHVPKEKLFLVCSPWAMHGAGSRNGALIGECYNRFLEGDEPIPAKQ